MLRKGKYPLVESCNPSTCISGNMMKCNRIVAGIFRKHLKPFGITNSQLSILFIITKAKEVNQKKLGEYLYMEKSTVNRNLRRLLEAAYIKQNTAKYVKPTAKGLRFLESVIPSWNDAMDEATKALGKEGTGSLSMMLQKLTR